LDVSNLFQKEKTYYLTEQIRRSSRSVSVNMIEAFRNRLYPNHFINKLTDCDTKNPDTQTRLEFSLASKYISPKQFNELTDQTLQNRKLYDLRPKEIRVSKNLKLLNFGY